MFGVYYQPFTPFTRRYTAMPCAHFGISGCKGNTLFILGKIIESKIRRCNKDLTKNNFEEVRR